MERANMESQTIKDMVSQTGSTTHTDHLVRPSARAILIITRLIMTTGVLGVQNMKTGENQNKKIGIINILAM